MLVRVSCTRDLCAHCKAKRWHELQSVVSSCRIAPPLSSENVYRVVEAPRNVKLRPEELHDLDMKKVVPQWRHARLRADDSLGTSSIPQDICSDCHEYVSLWMF